jgi:hypothetical protein
VSHRSGIRASDATGAEAETGRRGLVARRIATQKSSVTAVIAPPPCMPDPEKQRYP